jgi:hypothetical protein
MRKNKIKELKPDPNSRYKQGYYKLANPDKYVSDDKRIIYRSGLELKFCQYCDYTDNILEWVSEPFAIPYIHPLTNKMRNYYVDYLIKKINPDGTITTYLIEAKASNMLKPPPKPSKYASKKVKNRYAKVLARVLVNIAKYKYAKKYCEKKGYRYAFLTEEFFSKKK